MCEQCLTAPISFGEPIEGFTLMRARRDGTTWTKGQWALIEAPTPDPAFTWELTPTPDPTRGLTDAEIEDYEHYIPETHPDYHRTFYYTTDVFKNDFTAYFVTEPETGHRLVEACIKAGYDPESEYVTAWLFNHLGNYLVTATLHEEMDVERLKELDYYSTTDFTIGKDPIPGERSLDGTTIV